MGQRFVFVALAIVALIATNTVPALAAPPPAEFRHLDPGGPPDLRENVPVNIVFVGYEPAQVPQSQFAKELPSAYRAVVRSRLWYGVTEYVGLNYTFGYSVTYADSAFENTFFSWLSSVATPATRTLFQEQYNAQAKNVLDVGQNHFIDAPTVEKWLIDHAPAGVDTTRNTVFFINWYGRADFKFHTYVKLDEPDPDTGYNFGQNRQSRKIIAWGGTTPDDEETGLGSRGVRRVWFHDLSAGPESWTDNWNVDDADVDGDGSPDFRLPATWEYMTAGGYRPASALAGDLGKLARYGAVNLLFTPSPLYPPYITPDRQPASINLDLNTYEGWRGVNASSQFQKPALAVQEIGEVHQVPYNADRQQLALSGEARNCYVLWLRSAPCYPDRPTYHPFANLFLYNALNIEQTWDGGAEYEGMFFNYSTEDQISSGFLGYADDNWIDGTQSFTFNFISPGIVAAGYGLTTTQIHEYGHHFGMSHPHDGYDYETGVDYGPAGAYYFAWATDEVNSMMSYIDLNWDYSQFDRDNANRYQATAYIRGANRIAEQVLASPNAQRGAADLRRADGAIGDAKAAMAAHDYPATFASAKGAYEYARAAATAAGVTVHASSLGWTVLDPTRGKQAHKRDYAYVDRFGVGKRFGP